MNRAIPLSEIENFEHIAIDLNSLLKRDDNNDIAEDFPGIFTQYTKDVDKVTEDLSAAKELFAIGKREQFIIFAGKRAVGLSIAISHINTPEGVNSTWPNLSGFICNPFRGQGLGRLSLETRMQAVRENFNNHAWTIVKNGNGPSEHLITSVGFKKAEQNIDEQNSHSLYLYGADDVS